MKAKDVFGVAVRIIGLAFLYHGLSHVTTAFGDLCPLFPPPSIKYLNFRSLIPNFITIALSLLIAWWMIRGAPWLLRLAYPEAPSPTSAPPTSSP
jgi:hypothetical protein